MTENLEYDLKLLGVTGVEGKLPKDAKPSLELLRNAGIKIWMLTGDKVAKLVSKGRYGTPLPTVCLLLHSFCLRAILTRVWLCSETKRLCLQCLRIPPQQHRLLSHHGRRIPRTLPRHEQIRVHTIGIVVCRCTPPPNGRHSPAHPCLR